MYYCEKNYYYVVLHLISAYKSINIKKLFVAGLLIRGMLQSVHCGKNSGSSSMSVEEQ